MFVCVFVKERVSMCEKKRAFLSVFVRVCVCVCVCQRERKESGCV